MRSFFPLFLLIGCRKFSFISSLKFAFLFQLIRLNVSEVLGQTMVQAWDVNHEYIYRYEGRVWTGPSRHLRALNRSDNMRIVADVSVKVLNQQFLILQLRNSSFQSQQIHLDDQQVRQLESVFYAILKNGAVKQFASLSAADWVLNVHKSLLSLMSVRSPDGRGSLHNGPWDGRSAVSYQLTEDEVTGICENSYDVARVAEYLPAADPALHRLRSRFCPASGDHLYRVIKTRNFDQCQEVPIYNVVAPAGWRCKPGTAVCENVQSRSLVSRFEACGDLRDGGQLLHMESREAFITLPLGARFKSQTVTIDQQLTLSDKQPVDVSAYQPAVPNHAFSQSLVYTEPDSGLPDDCADDLVPQVKELYRRMLDVGSLVDRSWSDLQRRMRQCLQHLNYDQLEAAAHAARDQLSQPEWSVFIHQVAWLGSDDSLAVCKHLILNKFLSSQDAITLISSLSMFLRTPTDYVLGQLLSFLELDLVKSDAVLRQTTMVSLASIVRLACIDRKSSETRFPTMRHGGRFCTGASRDAIPRRLVQLLTPYLSANETQAESGDVMAVLSAFNILGHDSIIDVVVPLIEGRSVDNPSLRSKAVLTLHKLAHSGDQQAVRILHTVYANPSENYQVRMAAFTLLMLSDPPEYIWQNIAIRTWFEPRSHVTSFIYTTLETLASFQSPVRFLRKLSQKARRVLKLAKRPSGRGLHYSSNYIWSHADSREVLASYLRLETFANKASLFPKELYGRINFNLGASDFDFLEFEVHGHQMESLVEALLNQMRGPEETGTSKKCRTSSVTNAAAEDVFNRLHVKYHADQGRGDGYVHWTLMESVERFWSFQGEELEQLVKDLLKHKKVERHQSLEWFQLLPLVNVDISWPNSMGWITRIRVDGHILATLDGHYQLLRRANRLALDSQLKPTLALEIDTRLGIELKVPGDQAVVVESGWNLLHVASLPGKTDVAIDPPSGRLDVAWTSSSEETDDKQDTMILVHTSLCRIQSNSSLCPGPVTQDVSEPMRMGEQVTSRWLDALLIQLERPEGHWLDVLSTLSLFWMPIGPSTRPDQTVHLQWKAARSDQSAFKFSAQLEQHDVGRQSTDHWIMTSGTTRLVRTSKPPESDEIVDGIRLTFNALGANNSVHVRHLDWKIQPFLGECVIRADEVETFDGVSYNASLTDQCQYLAAGVVTKGSDKVAVLLDRQSGVNSGVELLISDVDRIRVDLESGRLRVNDQEVPLESGQAFRLQSACRSMVWMRAARTPTALWLDLPRHGLQLQLTPAAHLHIKARRSVRGKVQGLCGDLNEEKLFEFRSPERCVLTEGRLMAAAYQTRPQCHVPGHLVERLKLETTQCPRHEGTPTLLRQPFH